MSNLIKSDAGWKRLNDASKELLHPRTSQMEARPGAYKALQERLAKERKSKKS